MNCKKHSQPQSALSSSREMIEKRFGDSSDRAGLNVRYEIQLRSLMKEMDSIVSHSAPVESSVSFEAEVTKLSAALFMENDPEKIFKSIAALLFDTLKITFEKNENDPDAIFPQKIIQSRRGTCLGISLVVLQICEKLGFPVYGVLVPGHFFVRYSDGVVKRNFEPLRRGENMPEQWYREKWPNRDTARYSLRNCTKNEVIGVVCYVLGNSLFAEGRFVEAISFFNRAQGKFPEMIEAKGNAAIAYEKIGKIEKAVKIIGDLAKEYPLLDGIHSRYASLLLKSGKYSEAELEYGKALEIEPGNVMIQYGYAMTLFSLKKCDEAFSTISRVLVSRPDFEAADLLKSKIRQQCGK